jgi:hypothetical protein
MGHKRYLDDVYHCNYGSLNIRSQMPKKRIFPLTDCRLEFINFRKHIVNIFRD